MSGSASGRKRRNRRIQEPGREEEKGHGLHPGVASEGEEEGRRRWRFLTGQHYDAVWVKAGEGAREKELCETVMALSTPMLIMSC